jgi:hypothetical protein
MLKPLDATVLEKSLQLVTDGLRERVICCREDTRFARSYFEKA